MSLIISSHVVLKEPPDSPNLSWVDHQNSSVLDRLEIRHAFDLESFVRLLAEASTASLIVIDNLGSLYPDSNTQSERWCLPLASLASV